MLLRSKAGAMCMMHSSLTQWKNLFSFEIIGEEGYITVEGLGESYGTQTLFVGRRDFEAPFQDLVTHFRGKDRSWALEWKEFSDAVAEGRAPIGDGQDGLEALRIILAGYEAAVGKRTLTLG
jgi:1,5-anhydro-D-fructose reductase (1,5-anhydro-D-mannitol-forming)